MINSNYAVIIVTYNPNENFVLKNIDKLLTLNFVKNIIVVDNSDKKSHKLEKKKIKYIFLNGNKGIAYAQNMGIKICLKSKIEYIFFFDQDTSIDLNILIELSKNFIDLQKQDGKIGILCPTYIDNNGQKSGYSEFEFSRISECISSSSLISAQVFNKIGLMEDRLFIDYVDFEFCWRASVNGFHIYKANNLYLTHPVGQKVMRVFGKNIYIPSPNRHYYVYRNSRILFKRDYVPKRWKRREIILNILMPIIVCLFLNNKIQRLKFIRKGIKDGKNYKE